MSTPPQQQQQTLLTNQPVLLQLIRARNVVKADVFSESDPYCVCSIRSGGQPVDGLVPESIEHRWPTIDDEPNPYWGTTVWLAKSAPPGSCFHLRLYDYDATGKDDLLGIAVIHVESLVVGKVITLKLPYISDAKKIQEVDILFREFPKETKKRVIIIRHGESEWNDAQSKKNLKTMVSRVDHPLTNTGCAQALGLAGKIANAIASEHKSTSDFTKSANAVPPEVEDFLKSEVVYVSPLCRAVQTAVLALHPLGPKPAWELKRNAREKRNFGGRDSSGTTFGKDLMPFYAKEFFEMHQTYDTAIKHAASPTTPFGGRAADFSVAPMPSPPELAQMLEKLNTTEAETKWWQDDAEGHDDSSRRIGDLFFQQVMFDERPIITVVGHSHFFRDLLAFYMSNSVREKIRNKSYGADQGFTLEQWTTYKLENCGALHLEFDYSAILASWKQGTAAGMEDLKCIEKATLLFGTKLIP